MCFRVDFLEKRQIRGSKSNLLLQKFHFQWLDVSRFSFGDRDTNNDNGASLPFHKKWMPNKYLARRIERTVLRWDGLGLPLFEFMLVFGRTPPRQNWHASLWRPLLLLSSGLQTLLINYHYFYARIFCPVNFSPYWRVCHIY
jgi:hypothetical protein